MSSPDIALAGPRPRIPLRHHIDRLRARLSGRRVDFGLSLVPDNNLLSHARTELHLAGMLDEDSSYGGMLGTSTLRLMKLFALEGHSGGSASMQTALFEKVSRYQPLTPLTGAADEWNEIAEQNGKPLYQNRRCSHVFKEGDYAYDINGKVFREPSGACFTSSDSRVPVTFPYTPTTEYVDVPAAA